MKRDLSLRTITEWTAIMRTLQFYFRSRQVVMALMMLFCMGAGISQSSADLVSAAHLSIDAAARRLQATYGIAVDISVATALYSEFTNFAVTYKSEPGCAQVALGSGIQTGSVIDQYFRDVLIDHQSTPKTLYARLAESCGSSAEASGWPSHATNTFGTVLLAQGAIHIARYDPSGAVIDFGDVSRGIALLAGRYELGNLDAPQVGHLIVTVSPGGTSTLSQWAGTSPSREELPPNDRLADSYWCTNLYLPPQRPRFGSYPAVMAGRGGRNPAPVNPATFSTASAAIVDVTAPPNTCGAACGLGVARIIVNAISGWRAICTTCSSDALVGIYVLSVRFVDSRALDALRSGATQIPSRGSPPPGMNPLQQSAAFAVPGNMYIEVPAHDPTICSAVTAGATPWQTAIRHVVCDNIPQPSSSGAAQMLVQFVPGTLDCVPGSAGSFIACGTVDHGVQLSLADLRYEWTDPHSKVLLSMGQGPDVFDLQNVLLHEIGHWMGMTDADLPNRLVDGKTPIMSNTYGGRACISASERAYLSAAADLSWTGRLANCSGLRRPERHEQ